MENLSPLEFVKQHLIEKLNAKHIVVGVDFHFAKNRTGTVETLIDLGLEYDFTVEPVEFITQQGIKISSTSIREALLDQNIENANKMLGRSYSVLGKVMKGKQIGRTIGYPTANIDISKRDILLRGVFCIKAAIEGDKRIQWLGKYRI